MRKHARHMPCARRMGRRCRRRNRLRHGQPAARAARGADTSDRPFENLVSGTAVEVLERNPNYARVRLADGREGWVKATFSLPRNRPPRACSSSRPRSAVSRVLPRSRRRRPRPPPSTSSRACAASYKQRRALPSRFKRRSSASSARTVRTRSGSRLTATRCRSLWVLPAVVVALVAGFLVGLWWLDALIRRRHGGFRVY